MKQQAPRSLEAEAGLSNIALQSMRSLADQAFSRAAGAPLIEGNDVRLLWDATENYPAWLDAIEKAQHRIHFEIYFIQEDATGRRFADALIAKAREGVRVRVVYDWLGGFRRTSSRFWRRLREEGIEVRCYNPPRLDSPFGWLSRDHRKMLVVDGRVGFVSGLCVGADWEGNPEANIDPWRDTGIRVEGPAVAEIERAFAELWELMGPPLPKDEIEPWGKVGRAGDVPLRVVATVPATTGMLRLDQLFAALARKRIWITDAYYGAMPVHVQALRAAAKAGVDVRLLVPNATDIPLLKPLSRAGYRPLLEAGVRVYEWNGSMLHAKTAVTDGRWARVGSTNLNVASWFGNCELDVVIEDERIARELEEKYLRDLRNATEIVLDARRKIRVPNPGLEARAPRPALMRSSGSVGPATTGAIRLGHALGAVVSARRVLEPVELRLMTSAGFASLALAALVAFFPRAFAYPVVAVLVWVGLSLLLRAGSLLRRPKKEEERERG